MPPGPRVLYVLGTRTSHGRTVRTAYRGTPGRETTWTIGQHSFNASEVAAAGRFVRGGQWRGPPRSHLAPRFGRWTHHLLEGIEVEAKAIEHVAIQVDGGYQNDFIFAERPCNGSAAVTPALWDGLAERRQQPTQMPQLPSGPGPDRGVVA